MRYREERLEGILPDLSGRKFLDARPVLVRILRPGLPNELLHVVDQHLDQLALALRMDALVLHVPITLRRMK